MAAKAMSVDTAVVAAASPAAITALVSNATERRGAARRGGAATEFAGVSVY